MSDTPQFNTPFLNHYMRMVEDTESPRLFHVWSAVSALAGSLGRRCWLPFGVGPIFPNHYILIVGTPAARKSTAVNIMKRVVKQSTGVNFAPADTAGQRQGLVEAMRGGEAPKEYLDQVELAANENSLAALTLDAVASITNEPDPSDVRFVADADKHHIMVVAGEFSRFIGQNNLQMLDFLTTMYDGDDYEYQTKAGKTTLRNPLINIIGATTPTSISTSMPPAAGGQGFLSRVILVYGARKYKLVPRPQLPAEELVNEVKEVLERSYSDLAGPFEESDDARKYSEDLYNYALEISDPRFGYYHERRYTHLIKLAMCLAAGRGSTQIEKDDYFEAHRILRATERGMPDALGEFGMNPLASLKQSMLEFCRTRGALALDELRAVFHRDSRATEFMEAVNDLNKMQQIVMTHTRTGQTIISAKLVKEDIEDLMFKTLAE